MQESAIDASIPVLTEIIDNALPPLAAAAVHVPGPAPSAPPNTVNSPAAVDAEWSALQRKVTERVLQSLAERIDFVLEQRVRDSLAAVIQTAVGTLATELQRGLHQTLDEMVARAVAQEIAKLRAQTPRT